MNVFGWVSQKNRYRFVFISVFSIFLSYTSLTAIGADPFALEDKLLSEDYDNATSSNGLFNTESTIEFYKNIITDIKNLNYYTAQELRIPLPGIDQEFVARWGFGGSGDLFSPLPWTAVQLKSGKKIQDDFSSPFSLAEFGKVILQDKLTSHAKQISFLKWLLNKRLSPLKLFFLKLFILVKNYNYIDIKILFTEALRLFIRLSITDTIDLVDPTKPFSSYMPELIKEQINQFAPQIMEIMDALWSTVITKNNTSETSLAEQPNQNRTIQAFLFNNETLALQCLKQFKNYKEHAFTQDVTSFIESRGYQLVDYQDFIKLQGDKNSSTELQETNTELWNMFNPLNKIVSFRKINLSQDNNLPEELPNKLKEKALSQTTQGTSDILYAKTNSGICWIACVTDRLDCVETFKQIGITLIRTIKAYVSARTAYFQSNPLTAQAFKKELEKRERAMRKLKTFLQTEEGLISSKRLEEKVRLIKQNKKPTTKNTVIEVKIKQATTEHNELEEKLNQAHGRLQTFQQLKRAIPHYKTIVATENDIKTLKNKLKTQTQKLVKLNSQKENLQDTKEEQKEHIKELRSLATTLKQSGETLSPELSKMINELEGEAKEPKQSSERLTLKERLIQRAKIAQIYQQEANIIEQSLDSRKAIIQTIPSDMKRKIKLIKFSAIEKPGYEAYINYLQQMSDKILTENKKVEELVAYRQAFVSLDPSSISDEQRQQKNTLERKVGHIIDNQEITLTSISSNLPELQAMMNDLSSNTDVYEQIKKQLMSTLHTIIQKSDHIQEKVRMYRYLVQKFMPEFSPVFQELSETTSAA